MFNWLNNLRKAKLARLEAERDVLLQYIKQKHTFYEAEKIREIMGEIAYLKMRIK